MDCKVHFILITCKYNMKIEIAINILTSINTVILPYNNDWYISLDLLNYFWLDLDFLFILRMTFKTTMKTNTIVAGFKMITILDLIA